MDHIIKLAASQETHQCWMCHDSLSPQALFCTSCGGIQPPRYKDHFQALGFAHGIDIDHERLERNLTHLRRTFDTERFMIRGIKEQEHARAHQTCIEEGFAILSDVMKRSRYLMSLHAGNPEEIPDISVPDVIAALQQKVQEAAQPSEVDILARQCSEGVEKSMVSLLQALRDQQWKEANYRVHVLDGFETVLNQLRLKREALTLSK